MAANPNNLPPLPADHLDHPESWATGGAPATDKQKGFVKVLERQHPELVPDQGLKVDDMGKSEASEVIDHLKSGKQLSDKGGNPGEIQETESETKMVQVQASREAKTQDDEAVEILEEQAEKLDQQEKKEKVGEKRKDGPSAAKKDVVDDGDADDEQHGADTGGKDLKKTKQTTLDEPMGSASRSTSDETKEEGRKTKKAKVNNEDGTSGPSRSPNPEDISRPANPLAKEPPVSSNADDIEFVSGPTPVTSSGATKEDSHPNDTTPGDGDHLDHPENWATGYQPATDKQKGYLKVLEKQKGMPIDGDVGTLGKSEASEKIDELQRL